MKRLKFNGLEKLVSNEEIEKDIFDIDFCGKMMVQFSKENGEIIPINAMNAGGFNCYSEIKDKKLIIEDVQIRIFVLNYDSLDKAILGEQSLKGAYPRQDVLNTIVNQIEFAINNFGIEILEDGSFDSVQPFVAIDIVKVYWLSISKVIHKKDAIIVHLYFKGFLK